MRKIDKIIWHCTATPEGRDVGVDEVRHWHVSPPRNWSDIGYHFVIELDGAVKAGRPLVTAGAHVRGQNAHSIGIAYVGGLAADGNTPKDTRTAEQRKALYDLTHDLLAEFPGATVHGHNEFSNKACPSFDAAKDWKAHLTGAPLSVEQARADAKVQARPQFRTADADPVAEAARKPAAQKAGGLAGAASAIAAVGGAFSGMPWQGLAVLAAVVVVLAIVFRKPLMERLS